MTKKISFFILFIQIFLGCTNHVTEKTNLPLLKVSENKRYLVDENGNPFFWLGDTGWLLFVKCNREDVEKYLENRKQKGFNVIQVMVIHDINNAVNVYGDSALICKNVATPNTTNGSSFENPTQYDFWDHVDFVVDLAAQKGIYMALVPIWGSNVKHGKVTVKEAETYAAWLTDRYKNKSNIIWINGGDISGNDSSDIWNKIGNTIHGIDTNHLITYHPRGRMISSDWFHQEPWLDFNMFQSGHRRYDQDDTKRGYGQDNWQYVNEAYGLSPIKPVIDGEPSYEDIPQGLHDTTQPYWNASDVRRYAYWSVFAGAFGFTYGQNEIMQFHKPGDQDANYGPKKHWYEALDAKGATQLIHLKNLMLSKPYTERVPDQSLIAEEQGEKYDYIAATRGNKYAFIYTFTGKNFSIDMGNMAASEYSASWYNPRNGEYSEAGEALIGSDVSFNPPGEPAEGND